MDNEIGKRKIKQIISGPYLVSRTGDVG